MVNFLLGLLCFIFVILFFFWVVGTKERKKIHSETNIRNKKMKNWQDVQEHDYEHFKSETLSEIRSEMLKELNKPSLDSSSNYIMPLDSVLLDLGYGAKEIIQFKIYLIDAMLVNHESNKDMRTIIDTKVGQPSYHIRKNKRLLA
tara:strand:- start:3208 stop:3642 length:435 start_codon:yes stop_codon:yes gene_type:complete